MIPPLSSRVATEPATDRTPVHRVSVLPGEAPNTSGNLPVGVGLRPLGARRGDH